MAVNDQAAQAPLVPHGMGLLSPDHDMTKFSKQSALAVQQYLRDNQHQSPVRSRLRSPEPDGGLTNCLLYEETFINSDGDMPHHDECMGQQDRYW